MTLNVPIPRVNANDDQVSIVELYVAIGDVVNEDDLLAEIETTKAAAEIRSPAKGTVTAIACKAGEFIDVGATLCVLSDAGSVDRVERSSEGSGERVRVVTAKARRRAEDLGVDIDAIKPDADGRITLEAVENHARKSPVPTRASAVPSSRPMPLNREGGAVIVGAGGHAAAVIDALAGQAMPIVGCVDDNPDLLGKGVNGGIEVIGTTDLLSDLLKEGVEGAFLGIGGVGDNGEDNLAVRAKIAAKLEALGFYFPAVVSRHAYLGQGSVLGPGTVLFPGAVVGPRCRIGAHVIVNQGSQICHDCTLEDDVHITPGAILGGHCHVGSSSIIGMGASLLLNTVVGRGCLIHNNAAIMTNVRDHTEVYTDGRRFERNG